MGGVVFLVLETTELFCLPISLYCLGKQTGCRTYYPRMIGTVRVIWVGLLGIVLEQIKLFKSPLDQANPKSSFHSLRSIVYA